MIASRLLAALGTMLGARRMPGPPAAGSEEARKNQQVLLDNLAKEHARAYNKLFLEPTTIEGVKLAVRQSGASTIHGQDQRNVFMIIECRQARRGGGESDTPGATG